MGDKDQKASITAVCDSAALHPEVAMPEHIRRRQATQTIATAPEPCAWLVRTEWPAQLAAQQHQAQAQAPSKAQGQGHDALAQAGEHADADNAAVQGQPWFADPLKGRLMSLADCQKQYPHMQLVRQSMFCSNLLLH